MNTANRRAAPRIKARRGHYASYPGGVAAIRDISLGGVMLEEREPIPRGNRMLLELHLGSQMIACTGVVKRSSVDDGTAVQFLEMSSNARKLLGGYLMQMGLAENRRRLNEGMRSAAREYRAASATAPTPKAPPLVAPRLGELLMRRGVITQGQLAAVLVEQQAQGGRFCALLVRLGIVAEEDLLECCCREYRLPAIDLTTVQPTNEALARVPHELSRRHQILPIGVSGSTLTVAIGDPSNLDGLNEVKFRSGRDLRVSLAPVLALEEAIERCYAQHVRVTA
jgi:Type II secretion system (T2SS), protein E, N-terminal domain/PilZ domain